VSRSSFVSILIVLLEVCVGWKRRQWGESANMF
jgi:hypothetical protein